MVPVCLILTRTGAAVKLILEPPDKNAAVLEVPEGSASEMTCKV